jgi:hypothetical protein
MQMTYNQLVPIVVDSIEAALGVSHEELVSIEEGPTFDLGFDQGVDVEIDFDEPFFMHKYYDGSIVSMTFNVTKNEAAIHAFIGTSCSNPDLADEFIDRFMETTRFPGMWGTPQMCESYSGLMLTTDFSFATEKELGEEFVKRLSLFTNERFTNEMRPFLHYFED